MKNEEEEEEEEEEEVILRGVASLLPSSARSSQGSHMSAPSCREITKNVAAHLVNSLCREASTTLLKRPSLL